MFGGLLIDTLEANYCTHFTVFISKYSTCLYCQSSLMRTIDVQLNLFYLPPQDEVRTQKATKQKSTLESANNSVKLLNEMLAHFSPEDSTDGDKELIRVRSLERAQMTF